MPFKGRISSDLAQPFKKILTTLNPKPPEPSSAFQSAEHSVLQGLFREGEAVCNSSREGMSLRPFGVLGGDLHIYIYIHINMYLYVYTYLYVCRVYVYIYI